jgi:hypothetical protein
MLTTMGVNIDTFKRIEAVPAEDLNPGRRRADTPL